jgi:hypothetical protein
MAGFTVFYDANVLYPAELRSLLMKNEFERFPSFGIRKHLAR